MRFISPKRLTVLTATLLLGGVVFVLSSSVVMAQSATSLTDDQKQQIITGCVSVKNSLTQLHASDALLRVNRGQVYESMSSKLMDRFNDRLGSNSLDNKAMLTVTASYRTQLATFRADYISYEQKVSAALSIDCTSKPTEFYNTIEEARTLRAAVHSDVLKLHQFIDDYRSSVGDFLLNFERVAR
jgi:hypothetical protein